MKTIAFAVALAVSGAAGAQDSAQQVMIPVVADHLPGAYGSIWQTELVVSNPKSSVAALWYAYYCITECGGAITIGPDDRGTRLDNIAGPFGVGVQGRLITELDPTTTPARFSLRVRDLSRQSQSNGTEIPVVRFADAYEAPFDLLNLPISEHFRHTLRVYDLSGGGGLVHATYVSAAGLVTPFSRQFDLTLTHQEPDLFGYLVYPGYAELGDPIAISEVPGGVISVRITPTNAQQRIWAFITVTNNDTQELTVISPPR